MKLLLCITSFILLCFVDTSIIYGIIAAILMFFIVVIQDKQDHQLKLQEMAKHQITNVMDLMPIGQFKDHSIAWIIQNHLTYAKWMVKELKSIKFSTEIIEAIRVFESNSK